jgi:signal transduction histidine kinase/CheY-like chemotaxis protein/ligand-binding sensor domain-containing protein
MNVYRFLVFILFATASLSSFSQKHNLKFEHLGANNGLSHSNVLCIFKDSRGFMWFGTEDGLNKYDGYKFKVYRHENNNKSSLSNSTIDDIIEDSKGMLWIGTGGGGLNSFDRKTEKFVSYTNDKDNPSSIACDIVNSILEDSQGNLWIGTEGQGLNRFDRVSKKFIRYAYGKDTPNSLSDGFVRNIFEDSDHNLWVGTNESLHLFDNKDETFTRFSLPHSGKGKLSNENTVWNIFEDRNHNLWIGTYGNGVIFIDQTRKKIRRFTNDPTNPNSLCDDFVMSIAEDDYGNLWFASENGGLSVFNPVSGSFKNFGHSDYDNTSLASSSLNCIYKDPKGDVWVGTYNGGVNVVFKDANKFTHYRHNPIENSLSSNKVLCFYEDSKENLWIGTDGGGVNLFDRESGAFIHYKNKKNNKNTISGNHVLGICEDNKQNLWIGTWAEGLTKFDRTQNIFKHYKNNPSDPRSLSSNNIMFILQDSDYNLWIGTHRDGLNLYDPTTDSFIHYRHNINNTNHISNDNIFYMLEDSKGILWIATDGGGLNRLDRETKQFITYQHDETKNSIINNNINCIYEDRYGDLWIGTDAGLNHWNRKTNFFTAYLGKDGLPNDMIHGILEDAKDNLWISTNKGISKFNTQTKKFRNYTIAHGLQSGEFTDKAFLKSRSGAMYFGGNNGFNEFFPDSIKEVRYDPPIVFTDFHLFNVPVPIANSSFPDSPLKESITETKEIVLPYEQRTISLEFASLHYTSPEHKQYAYILDGFDKDWNMVGSVRAATYTNLDPGEYIFSVKGLDNEGYWSTNKASLKLIITPPFWMTWWFRILAGSLLVFICIVYAYRARMKYLDRLKVTLERQEQRTHEVIREKENIQIKSDYLENINQQLIAQREQILLQQQEAEKARAEAEQATKAKSVFLATMSHELRTPMNGVIGMASLLSETVLTDEQREYTETINNCGESLLAVINDILDFSKIESGKMEMEEKDFDLRVCIEEVLDVFANKAAKIGLDLIYEIDQNVPTQIVSDIHRLRQVLLNLLGNAIKFTTKGEVFVGVHLVKADGDQLELSFLVRDTGIGIPENKVSSLFRAFSQVDSSTTRKYGGTGLGLVISEKLVELMGGKIAVESCIGRGTTFTFTIKTRISHAAELTQSLNLSSLEGRKVLIVDDNVTNCNILRKQLEHWKVIPAHATSGQEALTILSKDPTFDLVLTDMQMPEMDGIQLAQAIRQMNNALPVILISSRGDEDYKKHSELFSSVLNKPVKQNLLCKHILSKFQQQQEFLLSREADAKKKMTVDFAKQYPMSVLIVEDNLVNQKLAESVFVKLGYKPAFALNGVEALKAVEQKTYDLILMDVQMPEMDGLEATKMIRLRNDDQSIIIAMTANAMKSDREECMNAGMNDYMSKPFKIDILVSMLEKWHANIKEKPARKNSQIA